MYPGWGFDHSDHSVPPLLCHPTVPECELLIFTSCSPVRDTTCILHLPQPSHSSDLNTQTSFPLTVFWFSLLSQLIQVPLCAEGWQQVTPRCRLEPAWCVWCAERGRERGGRGERGAHAWERAAEFVKFREQPPQSRQVFTPQAGTPRWLSCHVVRSVGLEELTALWLME